MVEEEHSTFGGSLLVQCVAFVRFLNDNVISLPKRFDCFEL